MATEHHCAVVWTAYGNKKPVSTSLTGLSYITKQLVVYPIVVVSRSKLLFNINATKIGVATDGLFLFSTNSHMYRLMSNF